jgi:glycosyltransferase involved in cell wall biosynthesis
VVLVEMRDKMQEELISVIIPVYNVAPYLRECLDSVVRQTYTNLEIILIDDGSTDNSGKICDDYAAVDKRISVVHQENAGLGPARNTGLNICKGEYLTFVDSDDFLALDMIELLYKNAITKAADISICSFLLYDNVTREVFPSTRKYQDRFFTNAQDFLTHFFTRPPHAYVWAKLYRSKLFEQYRFTNIAFEDALMWVPICKIAQRFVISSQKKYFYRQRTGSITDNNKFSPKIFDLPVVWQQVRKDLQPYGPKLRELAAGNFYYHGYVCVLNNLCLSNSEKRCKEQVEIIRKDIQKDLPDIIHNGNLKWRTKGACLAAAGGIGPYKIIWEIFAKPKD